MPKKPLRVVSLILSAVALLSLAACTGGNNAVTTAPETTEEPVITTVIDLADLNTQYTVVRPDSASDAIVKAFSSLITTLNDALGYHPNAVTDWLAPGKTPEEYEILIGKTNREETAVALAAIKNTEWTVRVIGNKLVLAGATEEGTLCAVDHFVKNILPTGTAYSSLLSYTGKLDYPISSVSINGKDITKYTVAYDAGTVYSNAASTLIEYLEKNAASVLDKVALKKSEGDRIILTGTASDGSYLGYSDSEVYFKDGSVYICGGSKYSVNAALNSFISEHLSGEGDVSAVFTEGQIIKSMKMPDREAYISDPSLMPVFWEGLWTPSERQLDYQEKIDSLMAVNKEHIFTVSHRADFIFYPENSIEAMISVWKMGGDCVEIDVHFTKDGIPVIMHDATLTRMTNYSTMNGKNGLPSTPEISEWTLEQIKQLSLLEGQGGTGAAVTPYKIPTLEEALIAAKGRFFIILDKPAEWRYCEIAGLQENSAENYIYPWMKKTGNYESVLISYGTLGSSAADTLDAGEALKIQKYIYEDSGAKVYFYLRAWTSRNTAGSYAKKLAAESLTNSAILVNGACNPTDTSTMSNIKGLIKSYPNSMFGGWTIDDTYDYEVYWKMMYTAGMRSIMTNKMFYLVQYAAKVLS